jgi:hypothetical protein
MVAVLGIGGYVGVRVAGPAGHDAAGSAPNPQVTATTGGSATPAGSPAPRTSPTAHAAGGPSAAPAGRGGNVIGMPAANGSRPPAATPPVESTQWMCTERRWSLGHPAVGQACHAIGTDVQVLGTLSAVSGVRANIEMSVENADTGATAAGPFRCPNNTFSDDQPQHTCGPRTVTLASGRYRVVTRWTYYDAGSLAPPGSVVGDPFDW